MGREDTICLFDMDGTLTKPRKIVEPETLSVIKELKKVCTIGLVGGSDYAKILEQMGGEEGLESFDYVFSENGVVARKNGKIIGEESIATFMGEDKIQSMINFCLGYMSKLYLPAKRGTFIEYRTGLINVCPVGRSCSQKERDEFDKFDQENHIRKKFVEELEKNFSDYGLNFAIGGQISIDIFPQGWDKTYCLRYLEQYPTVYFFGDKTQKGGNDHEISIHPRVSSNTVTGPEHTIQLLHKNFKLN